MFAIINRAEKTVVGQTRKRYEDPNLAFVEISADLYSRFLLDPDKYGDFKVVAGETSEFSIVYNPSRAFSKSRLTEIPIVDRVSDVDVAIALSKTQVTIVGSVVVSNVEVIGLVGGNFKKLCFYKDMRMGAISGHNARNHKDIRCFVTNLVEGLRYGVVYL